MTTATAPISSRVHPLPSVIAPADSIRPALHGGSPLTIDDGPLAGDTVWLTVLTAFIRDDVHDEIWEAWIDLNRTEDAPRTAAILRDGTNDSGVTTTEEPMTMPQGPLPGRRVDDDARTVNYWVRPTDQGGDAPWQWRGCFGCSDEHLASNFTWAVDPHGEDVKGRLADSLNPAFYTAGEWWCVRALVTDSDGLQISGATWVVRGTAPVTDSDGWWWTKPAGARHEISVLHESNRWNWLCTCGLSGLGHASEDTALTEAPALHDHPVARP